MKPKETTKHSLRYFEFLKVQQFVSIIFVLFAAQSDFGRETARKVVAESVEAVEDIDDALLDGERGDRELYL